MIELSTQENEQIRTGTLVVWIKSPHPLHQSWWICYYSTDANEARAWDRVIKEVCIEQKLQPFHQGTWPMRHETYHPDCKKQLCPDTCPGVIQGWEMLAGCSRWGLEFPKEPLDVIVELGDENLAKVLAAIPVIREKAQALQKRWAELEITY